MELLCGDKRVKVDGTLQLNPASVGCSLIGGDDLYDLGFTNEELEKNDLKIIIGGELITVECRVSRENRLIDKLVTEYKLSRIGAEFLLRKHKWNYGQAVVYVRTLRAMKTERKPCGEILGPSGECNLRPSILDDAHKVFAEYTVKQESTDGKQ